MVDVSTACTGGSGPSQAAVTDRVAGTLLGLAAGDGLGAGYEFGHPPAAGDADMVGGGLGPWAPGEWTDDTQMAICVAEVTAQGSVDPDAIGAAFLDWFRSHPPDVGVATRSVLAAATSGRDLVAAARRHLAAHPGSAAGNGALMRTAPIALAHLGDAAAIASSACAVAELTHADPLAGDSCVLWCIAVDRAVREGRLDGAWDGLARLPDHRRDAWRERLEAAERQPPAAFTPNGFTVTALQAAHAAVSQTPLRDDAPPAWHLHDALQSAVAIGDDTDTVAAIAGALLGARWGASAVPFRWRRRLHGWPGYRARDLVRLAVLTARGGPPSGYGWPTASKLPGPEPAYATALPGDPGVVLGNLAALPAAAGDVDAVVSLCRVGTRQVPERVEHHEVVLVDEVGDDANPNLAFVLADTAEAIATLREEGKRVFLHCAGGRSRTPTVAAAYLARRDGIDPVEAFTRIARAVPQVDAHNRSFQQALAEFGR